MIKNTWNENEPFKFLAFADIHIGCLKNFLGEAQSLERTKDAFNEISLYIDNYKPHVIFIVGDLFHLKNITSNEVNLWNTFFSALLKDYLCVIQPGNHDFLTDSHTHIDYLQELYNNSLLPNLFITTTDIQDIIFTNGKDEIKIVNIPCEGIPTIEDLKGKDIVLYHGDVKGAIYDNNYQLEDDDRISFDWKLAKVFVLGDIHKRQFLADNAAYTASMYQTKFSEDEDKGFLIGEITNTSYKLEHINLNTPKKLINVIVETLEDWPTEWPDPDKYWVKLKHHSNISLHGKIIPSNVVTYQSIGKLDRLLDLDTSDNGNLYSEDMYPDSEINKLLVDKDVAHIKKVKIELGEIRKNI